MGYVKASAGAEIPAEHRDIVVADERHHLRAAIGRHDADQAETAPLEVVGVRRRVAALGGRHDLHPDLEVAAPGAAAPARRPGAPFSKIVVAWSRCIGVALRSCAG
jgi:hypothetical protein